MSSPPHHLLDIRQLLYFCPADVIFALELFILLIDTLFLALTLCTCKNNLNIVVIDKKNKKNTGTLKNQYSMSFSFIFPQLMSPPITEGCTLNNIL